MIAFKTKVKHLALRYFTVMNECSYSMRTLLSGIAVVKWYLHVQLKLTV